MLLVGELINSSRKKIEQAIKDQDVNYIQEIAKDQFENGADYIDVNAGTFVGKEGSYMNWLVSKVQETVDAPCCIDSPDPQVVEEAMKLHKGIPMVNSISLEKERFDALLPVVSGNDCKVIALCMSDDGMPETMEDRVSIAENLVNKLVQKNVPIENIYVDPLVQPISTNDNYGREFLNAIEQIMTKLPGVHTMCGLSNISYGLPHRALMNQAFMIMAITKGLDGAIVNPLDKRMMASITAAETLAGRDTYCMNYLDAYRSGKLEL
ncbi:MAG: methyltetrahydrofolate cobalamin methyltransferase [Thermodesulfobacteriota bacterium]